jgi:hypothetical protein
MQKFNWNAAGFQGMVKLYTAFPFEMKTQCKKAKFIRSGGSCSEGEFDSRRAGGVAAPSLQQRTAGACPAKRCVGVWLHRRTPHWFTPEGSTCMKYEIAESSLNSSRGISDW